MRRREIWGFISGCIVTSSVCEVWGGYSGLCLNWLNGSGFDGKDHEWKYKFRNCFAGGSGGKESAYNARNLSLIPGLERAPEGGHGNPLQYSCLENPKD